MFQTKFSRFCAQCRQDARAPGDPKLIRDKNGKAVDTVFEKSDRLLIHLMKHGEAQKKWRGRIVQVGNISIDAIERCGAEIGLSKEQIEYLQG
ncbi:MAG: hypothetical protein H0W45_11330 [Acidobacteria bacterium]|nr:hypothetical protein [Acidobacteriota bacterium]